MKKLIVILLALVFVASMAIGCNPAEETELTDEPVEEVTEAPVEETEQVVLKVTSGLWSEPEEQQYVREETLIAFEEETGIKVELEVLSEGLIDSIKAQKESGSWDTDVVITHSGDLPKYINNGYVQPIDNALANTDITVLPAFNDSTTKDGNTYYVPISADVYLVIANQKALEYLPEGADVSSLTWEQYRDWAIAMAEGEGTAKTALPALAVKSMVYQVGGMTLSYGGDFPEINTDAAKKAWNLIGEMIAAGAVVESSFNYGDPIDLMKSEEAWLSWAHMSPVGNVYSSAPAQFVIGPAPAGSEGNGSIAGAWCLGITEGTENLEAAEIFIEYMTRPEVVYDYTQGTGGTIPPVQEVVDVLGDEPSDEVVKNGILTLEAGIPHGVPASDYTDWSAVKTVYDEIFQKLWDDDGIVDEAYLDEQQAKLEALEVE